MNEQEITQEKPRRRKKPVGHWWITPKEGEGPAITTRGAMEMLSFSSTQTIRALVRKGPEKHGLPAYIPRANGIGWRRKPIDEGDPQNWNNTMFYREDLEAWDRMHPSQNRKRLDMAYTDDEMVQVIKVAEEVKRADGSVIRSQVAKLLGWNSHKYPKLRAILEDAGYPLSPRQQKSQKWRRQYKAEVCEPSATSA